MGNWRSSTRERWSRYTVSSACSTRSKLPASYDRETALRFDLAGPVGKDEVVDAVVEEGDLGAHAVAPVQREEIRAQPDLVAEIGLEGR